MKALRVNALLPDLGGVALEDVPTPKPQAGEVLVKIRAATLGFPDFLMTHGGYQLKPPVPFSPGMEGAGEIAALGAGVSGWAVGDKVVCGGLGTFADYMLMPADRLRKIPDNLDFATAAATGSAYLIPDIGVNMPLIKGFSVVGVRAGEYGRRNPEKGAENQAAVWQLAAEGKISPHVHARLPLSDWREGFAMMAAREIIGRVIFEPDQ